MTRKDITQKVAKLTGEDDLCVDKIIRATMKVLRESLNEGENIELRGFGRFFIAERAQKVGRDFKRKCSVVMPAAKVPKFKPYWKP